MLVFSYAVELDVVDTQSADAAGLCREAATAYRKRAACRQAAGNAEAAARDLKRAEALEARASKADKADKADRKADAPAAPPPSRVTVRNGWGAAVTVVIAGTPFVLQPGQTRSLPAPPGSSTCEVQAGPHRRQVVIEAGGTYNIRE